MNRSVFCPLVGFAALLIAGCASAPAAPATSTAQAAIQPAECPPCRAGVDTTAELAEANRLIVEAGEHPSDAQLAALLPRLQRAALAGSIEAQMRYGTYVVGYFLTDEMFWPSDRPTAVSALAMLRVALRRGAAGPDGWTGLAREPVAIEAEELSLLPREWIDASVAEAARWERCHPAP